MPNLHPPPPPVHGLLSVKRGGQFSKRIRRLATLENATLELRAQDNAPVEWTMPLIDVKVLSDVSNFCITLTSSSFRIRLYAHSSIKFDMWLRALQTSSRWKVQNFYDIQTDQIVGEGQFGVVYKAIERQSKAVVAIKQISKPPVAKRTETTYMAQLLARECRISRLLSHSAIVNVRDVFEAPDKVYIVMDFMPYTLHDIMKSTTVLAESHAAHIMKQLLAGVSYLHGKNIVHRDIKPDNILSLNVSHPFSVKICDFGMANFPGKRVDSPTAKCTDDRLVPKRIRSPDTAELLCDENALTPFSRPISLHRLTEAAREKPKRKSSIGYHSNSSADGVLQESGTDNNENIIKFGSAIDGLTLTSAIGAPSYVAPELVKGHRYGKPVDVWGCGVMMFYMLSGYLPFEGTDAIDVLKKISVCELDFSTGSWNRVSTEAKRFVRMLMHPDPRKRITADCALENEWIVSHCSE